MRTQILHRCFLGEIKPPTSPHSQPPIKQESKAAADESRLNASMLGALSCR